MNKKNILLVSLTLAKHLINLTNKKTIYENHGKKEGSHNSYR